MQHLKTIHTFQMVNKLETYIEKAYVHLMDIIEKFQYQNSKGITLDEHCQAD
mgnify:CR=1 FL=1